MKIPKNTIKSRGHTGYVRGAGGKTAEVRAPILGGPQRMGISASAVRIWGDPFWVWFRFLRSLNSFHVGYQLEFLEIFGWLLRQRFLS